MRVSARLTGVMVVFLLLVAACGGSDSAGDGAATEGADGDSATTSAEAEGGEYVIGFSSDLVGPFGNLSNNILAGTEAYFDKVNADGGIDGHPVRLEIRDDRGDVQTAVGIMNEFDSIGVPAVLGNVSSVVWATTAPMAAELEVVQIAGGAVDSFVYPPQPYLYRYLMSARTAAQGQLQFALDQLGDEEPRLAVMRYDSAGTDAWAEAMIAEVETMGLELTVDEQRFPAAATDLSPAAVAVAGSDPNFVLTVMTDAQAPLAVEALRNRGYEGPIANWVGVSESTLQAVNDPNFYVIRDSVPPQVPEGQAVLDAAEAAGIADKVNHDFATNGYLAAKVTHLALEACGFPCDGPAFNEALLGLGEIDTEGLSGPGWGVFEDRHLMSETVSLWHLGAAGDLASTLAGDWFIPNS